MIITPNKALWRTTAKIVLGAQLFQMFSIPAYSVVSSGGKDKLGGITKRGDVYIRNLLIQGARAVLQKVGNKTGRKADWLNFLLVRKSSNVVAVALANKTARTVWAILSKNTEYRSEMTIKEAA